MNIAYRWKCIAKEGHQEVQQTVSEQQVPKIRTSPVLHVKRHNGENQYDKVEHHSCVEHDVMSVGENITSNSKVLLTHEKLDV